MMKEKWIRFMQGRYGVDQLSRCLLGLALAGVVIDMFVRTNVLSLFATLLIIVVYYRMFSRQYYKRQAENTWYLTHTYKLRMRLRREKEYAGLRKDFHIYKCAKCGQRIKIPRHKGKIMVTCPSCGYQFKKRS